MQTSFCARWTAIFSIVCLLLAAPAGAAPDDDAWSEIRSDFAAERYEAALERLQPLIEANPKDREALYYLAMIHWRRQAWVDAGLAYRGVLALDPNGPFGQDAKLWLATYGHLARAPVPTPTPKPTPRLDPLPLSAATPKPAYRKRPVRARSARPLPGHFKAADGTFEFVPPQGFKLLDEGEQGEEMQALFGTRAGGQMPPTLLMTWREVPDLAELIPDERAFEEKRRLALEAAAYGAGAKLERRFGGPCYRVLQQRGAWAAETLLFFRHGRLYAFTYGGAAAQLARHRTAVAKSLSTPRFYP